MFKPLRHTYRILFLEDLNVSLQLCCYDIGINLIPVTPRHLGVVQSLHLLVPYPIEYARTYKNYQSSGQVETSTEHNLYLFLVCPPNENNRCYIYSPIQSTGVTNIYLNH